jgi:uncharacterized protein
MKLSQDTIGSTYIIQAYHPEKVIINDTPYMKSVIVGPEVLQENWPVQSFEALNDETLAMLTELNTSLIILGTGSQSCFLTPKQIAYFYQKKIAIEMMSTQAACKTYAVLASEQRDFVAALIIESDASS